MSLLDDFRRVTRRHPCPVCGKPDWCLVSREGGADPVSALCHRVETGRPWGDAGSFHQLRNVRGRRRCRARSIRLGNCGRDFAEEAREYAANCTARRRDALAESFGVSGESLARLRLGWDDRAFTFPMEDGLGRVRGIRRRFPDGGQCAVTGSKNGIFVPAGLRHNGLLLVCEGASDTAAVLDLGFEAIGRPDCKSARKGVVRYVRKKRPKAIVIVADNDHPGRTGAWNLARALTPHCSHVRVITPPGSIKDAREWKCRGATRADVEAVILDAPELVLLVRPRRIGGRR